MKSKLYSTLKILLVLLFSILLLPKVYTQQKRVLTSEDKKNWELDLNGILSDNGEWVAYNKAYINGGTVMIVQNTDIDKKYKLPSIPLTIMPMCSFSEDSKWFALQKNDTLYLQDLKSGKLLQFAGTVGFFFSSGGRHLLSFNNDPVGKTLLIRDLKTFSLLSIKNVKEFSLNPERNILGIVVEDDGYKEVKMISLREGFPATVLASDMESSFSSLKWNKSGASIAFCQYRTGSQKQSIAEKYYVCRNVSVKPEIKILDPKASSGFPKGFYPECRNLFLSDDSKQLFLHFSKEKKDSSYVVDPEKDTNKSDVQIWSTEDKQVPPIKMRAPLENLWYSWWIDMEKMVAVADDEHPELCLTGDQKNVLLFNRDEYLPLFNYVKEYLDIYLKNLSTGEKKLILKKIVNQPNYMQVSPAGKYVAYFKDRQWWIYNIYKNTHYCLTEGIDTQFENIEDENVGEKPAFGNPGWATDDSYIFLYDQFDIWLMSPDGSTRTKITNGRASRISYRIYNSGAKLLPQGANFWFTADSFIPEDGLLITAINKDNLDKGLFYWSIKAGLKEKVMKARILNPIVKFGARIKASDKDPLLYVETDFDIPPRLMLLRSSAKEQLIYQSNPQYEEFYWGRSELVNYTSPDGKKLKGALFYPANFNPEKKYPMIVEVYEKKSNELHNFVAPSDKEHGGFNVTNYTADGYFVLMPDITYKINDPGISAANCVIAAVEKVLEKRNVDKDKIGLIGFSFGGYESSFIISQTNIFKAAVAGCGITDLADWYLTISPIFGVNITRVEGGQHRMQSPFYGVDFQRNSPMSNIQNINTPLLLWTGDDDPNVDWNQSKKFQIALWRLGKKSTFLVYPGEGHGVDKEVNQKDITLRIKNWFDYYLKGEQPAAWIVNN